MKSIRIESLAGYNESLEATREQWFLRFMKAREPEQKRAAFSRIANATGRRSPKFIAAYDATLGLDCE